MSNDWNIEKVLAFAVPFFANKNLSTPRLDAEVLLAFALKQDRIFLYSHYDTPLTPEELALYRELITRRSQGEPVAYITGYKEFMSLKLAVSPQVLIPRPDTEILVETAIELVRKHQLQQIVDVGTGSGAIAISVAHYTKTQAPHIFATDISTEALTIAQKNAHDLGVEIDFRPGHLLEPLCADNVKLDLILANLPYIPESHKATLPVDVRNHEPHTALFAGPDGLDLYRQLLPMAVATLKPGGFMLWEIDDAQADKVPEMLATDFHEIEVIKDLAGHRRVIKAVKR